jgi:hypothetical protein
LYPGRRCPLSTAALQEVIFDPEHLTKLLGQEDRVMKRNKQSSEAQLDSTMASCRSFTEGKVAWVIEKSFLLSTIPIPDILLAIWSMHRSSFLVLPSCRNLGTRFLLRGRAVTPRVTESLIKLLKMQLSLKAREDQAVEVSNQNLNYQDFKFEDKCYLGWTDILGQQIFRIYQSQIRPCSQRRICSP